MEILESEEETLILMLNSDNEDDINLALGIVNKMESNRRLLNKLIPDGWATWEEDIKWYKSSFFNKATYFRKDRKGNIPLYFNRLPNE